MPITHILSIVAAGLLGLHAHAHHQPGSEPAPAQPVAPEAPKPSEEEAPAKPAKKGKEVPRPSVDPASLPEPYAGVKLNIQRGIDALKVLENNEPQAALAMIDDALRESIHEPASVKEELRLVKGMILTRAGRPDGKTMFTALMQADVPDVGNRDTPPAARKAKALHAAATARPRGAIGAEAWREAVAQGADAMRDGLRKLHKDLRRNIEKREWNSVERQIEQSRAVLEAIDSVRDSVTDLLWQEIAHSHAFSLTLALTTMNRRAREIERDFIELRGRMRRSQLDPARGWLPLRDATRWGENRDELIRMKSLGQKLCDHYANGVRKWGSKHSFSGSLSIRIADTDIPEPRPGSTFNR